MIKMILQGEANLPTEHGEFVMRAYSESSQEQMPTVVLFNPNTRMDEPVNVRIHSECMTGDLFGSNKCECGEQLHLSMDIIGKEGGIVIYLRQEGRGIGIINKLHAYREQERGLDTVEANKILGFEIDARRYDNAICILQQLNIGKINLLTNNPDKVKAFENSAIEVVKRIPLIIPPKKENEAYIVTKREFFKHKI
jgi:GTP cyclohydrolase II